MTFSFKRTVVNPVVNPVINESLSDEEKLVIDIISKDASLSAKKAILMNKSDRSVQRLLSKLKEKGILATSFAQNETITKFQKKKRNIGLTDFVLCAIIKQPDMRRK